MAKLVEKINGKMADKYRNVQRPVHLQSGYNPDCIHGPVGIALVAQLCSCPSGWVCQTLCRIYCCSGRDSKVVLHCDLCWGVTGQSLKCTSMLALLTSRPFGSCSMMQCCISDCFHVAIGGCV